MKAKGVGMDLETTLASPYVLGDEWCEGARHPSAQCLRS